MNVSKPQLTRRTALIAAITSAAVLGFAGWAIAEGGVPLVSSPTSASDSVASTTTFPDGGSRGSGIDNVAVATNTHDGSTVYALSLKIVQTAADDVDPVNAAVAIASCSDCQTVAIALEGVLVAGSPSSLDPVNAAIAVNGGCSNCETLAKAYQVIVQNDTRVRISGAGRREIASIRKDLNGLRRSGLDIVTIKQRVDQYAARLLDVLHNEVVPIGRPRPSTTLAEPTTTTTAGATSPSTTVSTTTSTAPPTTTTTVAPTTTTVG